MSADLFLYAGGIIFLLSLIGYGYVSRLKRENTNRTKKEVKANLKKKTKTVRGVAHTLLGISILLVVIFLAQNAGSKYNIETLNFKVPIEVTDDTDYGAGHTDDPVPYEMKIPTSGFHSPHDLKFGFYKEKPQLELLVHNLEHGDIIINYRPDLDSATLDRLKYLTKFNKAGAGILAVPNNDIPAGKEIVVTAWLKTMELTVFDEQKVGTFIYDHINKGPEQIPASIRRGGGTM